MSRGGRSRSVVESRWGRCRSMRPCRRDSSPRRSASTRARRPSLAFGGVGLRSRSVGGRPIGPRSLRPAGAGLAASRHPSSLAPPRSSSRTRVEEATGAGERADAPGPRHPSRSVDQLRRMAWSVPVAPSAALRTRREPGQRRPAQSGRGRGSAPARCSVRWTKVAGSPTGRPGYRRSGSTGRRLRRRVRFTAPGPPEDGPERDLRRQLTAARSAARSAGSSVRLVEVRRNRHHPVGR